MSTRKAHGSRSPSKPASVEMAARENPAFDDHEQVVFFQDEASGLRAIIAVHSTALGPAAGGCRRWRYATDEDALTDVLRLSQGMSYKNAIAGLKFGGGKAVIIERSGFEGSDALYEKFGEVVESLDGAYITAEDVGMSVDIMRTIARRTKHVSGLPRHQGRAGGDPSPKTGWGVFKGIEAAIRFQLGRESVEGLTVAVQGVGNVGYHLSRFLASAGARLVVADIDPRRVQRVCDEFGANAVDLEEVLFQPVDVVAPCALGAVLNEESIPRLRTTIVAGAANNQLSVDADGRRLVDAGILYAPDYVINGGGIINVSCEYYGDVDEGDVMGLVDAIGPKLTSIFEAAAASGQPTNEIADTRAREIISNARGFR